MSDQSQQPIELHCRAVLHLSPEHFTIRGGGKELFINTLQSSEEDADMAELTRLREENERLRAEVEALSARLARYESAPTGDPAHVARAIARAYGALPEVAPSDWVASYWVLTTYAKAPQQFAAFARWANALQVPTMPPCKADLLSKADALYRRPLYHWESGTSKVLARLQIARTLKRELLCE